jgi:hypothetical protein
MIIAEVEQVANIDHKGVATSSASPFRGRSLLQPQAIATMMCALFSSFLDGANDERQAEA